MSAFSRGNGGRGDSSSNGRSSTSGRGKGAGTSRTNRSQTQVVRTFAGRSNNGTSRRGRDGEDRRVTERRSPRLETAAAYPQTPSTSSESSKFRSPDDTKHEYVGAKVLKLAKHSPTEGSAKTERQRDENSVVDNDEELVPAEDVEQGEVEVGSVREDRNEEDENARGEEVLLIESWHSAEEDVAVIVEPAPGTINIISNSDESEDSSIGDGGAAIYHRLSRAPSHKDSDEGQGSLEVEVATERDRPRRLLPDINFPRRIDIDNVANDDINFPRRIGTDNVADDNDGDISQQAEPSPHDHIFVVAEEINEPLVVPAEVSASASASWPELVAAQTSRSELQEEARRIQTYSERHYTLPPRRVGLLSRRFSNESLEAPRSLREFPRPHEHYTGAGEAREVASRQRAVEAPWLPSLPERSSGNSSNNYNNASSQRDSSASSGASSSPAALDRFGLGLGPHPYLASPEHRRSASQRTLDGQRNDPWPPVDEDWSGDERYVGGQHVQPPLPFQPARVTQSQAMEGGGDSSHPSDSESHEVQILRDNNDFIQNVSQFFNQQDISDILLKVGKQRFYGHKFVLAKSSEVFRTMLYDKRWQQAELPEIDLEESEECQCHFEAFLRFLYTAEVQIGIDSAVGILCLADKYSVMSLKSLCTRYMVENTQSPKVRNALNWYSWAKALHMEELIDSCTKTISWNMEQLISLPEWLSMDIDFVTDILCNPQLVVTNEFMLYMAVESWLLCEQHQQDLAESSKKLLPLVRFPMMMVQQLYKVETGVLSRLHSSNNVMEKLLNQAYRFRSLCPIQTELGITFNEEFYRPRNYKDLTVDTVRMQNTLRFGIQVDVRTYVGPVPNTTREGEWKITYRKSNDSWTLQVYCHDSAMVNGEARIQAVLVISDDEDRVLQVEASDEMVCSRGNHLTMVIQLPCSDAKQMMVLIKPLPN